MKRGENNIKNLPDDVKQNIILKYGSVEAYYNKLYNIGEQYYKAFRSHDEQLKIKVEYERNSFAVELESFGVNDGLYIVDSIMGDFDEDLVKNLYKH